MSIKELKKHLKYLKKLKKECHTKTKESRQLNKQIRELKETIKTLTTITNTKQKLIDEIHKKDKWIKRLRIDLNNFTEEELKKHIEKLKRNNNEIK